MKVNMTPNPLDVVTIHASQGDTEARQWEFELHNNGELIDTSGVTDQMVFKAYKGGTEQILPENTSVPTTSPIIADIQYKDALRSEQEFLYRESPTTVDGKAKITKIKGNTLVWNQLVENGNFADGTNSWRKTNQTDSISVSGNILSFHTNYIYGSVFNTLPTDVNNHVVLVKAQVRTQGNSGIVRVKLVNDFGYTNNDFSFSIEQTNVWTDVLMYGRYVTTPEGSSESPRIGFQDYRNISSSNLIEVKNVQVFDLTKMGLDISNPSDFTSLFPLSYYAYNQGTLLSFMGNGIKTVGANNMFDVNIRLNTNWVYQTASNRAILEFDVEPSTQYTIKIDYSSNVNKAAVVYKERYANRQISNMAIGSGVKEFTVTTPSNCRVLCIQFESNTSVIFADSDFPNRNSWYCLKDQSQISTLSLPISTYFPTGMKSAGSVYDELTETKAITRIGAVDLGSLTWTYASDEGHLRFVSSTISPEAKLPPNNSIANAVCTKYEIVTEGNVYNNQKIGLCIINNSRAMVCDLNYTDATAFKTAMDGVMLYYELATPTETSFTTASLVTENAEIPLSNEDGVLIGKCTEQLSSESGFIDAKIKLADEDGECYSNKIQLHVERSPQ